MVMRRCGSLVAQKRGIHADVCSGHVRDGHRHEHGAPEGAAARENEPQKGSLRGAIDRYRESSAWACLAPAALAASIEATKTGELTFLITERGQPFAKESFGNWFRKACTEAGVPGSAHGLRKAGATRAAENGASERELTALFGWSTGKMAVHDTKAANQKRLATEAVHMLLPKRSTNKNARTLVSRAGGNSKILTISGD